jgi:hypothetical protein
VLVRDSSQPYWGVTVIIPLPIYNVNVTVQADGGDRDIQYYADKVCSSVVDKFCLVLSTLGLNQVHKAGGKLLVDSTFAPPPLQYPFKFGADM